jgi:hypothetical protein
VRIPTSVDVEVGEEFREGTARYRIEGFSKRADGHIDALCRLLDGQHPFWWNQLAESPRMLRLEGTFLARMLQEKRAFLASSRPL